jgi:hypothetical protein
LISVSEPVFDDDLQSIIGFEVKRFPAIPATTGIRHPVQPTNIGIAQALRRLVTAPRRKGMRF